MHIFVETTKTELLHDVIFNGEVISVTSFVCDGKYRVAVGTTAKRLHIFELQGDRFNQIVEGTVDDYPW